MPEHLASEKQFSLTPPKTSGTSEKQFSLTPPKTSGTSTFGQRKENIFKRLQSAAEQCRLSYSDRKELATENDENVTELCEALEDAFSYGLKQQQSTTMTAVALFQNMQEIVTGNSGNSASYITFWDFLQLHLTQHERDRYINLKQVWTKYGRGLAFIRDALNETSLQRYLLTWLDNVNHLQTFYSQWSLLLDAEMAKELPKILGSLDKILFALTVDTTELNSRSARNAVQVVRREEPVIYAPAPVPLESLKHKRKINPIERPISSANSTDDLMKLLNIKEQQRSEVVGVKLELPVDVDTDETLSPPDPIEPEIEFLKQPLPEVYFERESTASSCNGYEVEVKFDVAEGGVVDLEDDVKSETSSQYSKSSSAISAAQGYNNNTNTLLEEKLREVNERCALLETRVAQLSLENRQLVRRLTQHYNESGIQPSSSLATNFLITIPNAKLVKSKHGGAHYSYEIHITMRKNLEHWVLQKRYSDFNKLRKTLLKTHPSVNAVEFPPKKHFGNMNMVFVEERRQQLQIYLLNLVEMLPQVEACKSKAELMKAFPFFRER